MTAVAPGLSPSVEALRAAFGSAVLRSAVSCGDSIVWVDRDRAHEVLAWLKNTPGQEFNYLTDITAVDYRDPGQPLEVSYQLRSLGRKVDLRVKVPLDKAKPLTVDSVFDLWRGADWLEREVFDMFGVRFEGHPELTRILTWDGFNGHPLRKEFPVEGIDTGAAIYPEHYGPTTGPVAGTGTGWKPPKPTVPSPADGGEGAGE